MTNCRFEKLLFPLRYQLDALNFFIFTLSYFPINFEYSIIFVNDDLIYHKERFKVKENSRKWKEDSYEKEVFIA